MNLTQYVGVVMEMKDWMIFSSSLKDMEIDFIIEPHIRFEGQAGEQATMFFYDPSGNALEFKALKILRTDFLRQNDNYYRIQSLF